MKKEKIYYLFCLLFFVLFASITFRCAWGSDMVFSASDLNIGRLAFKKYNLPEMLTGYFSANQVLGGAGSGMTLFHFLLALMPLEFFANTFYGLVLVVGSMATVWFLRIWGRSWLGSVLGALVAFWVNSIMLASGGHAYKMEVLALSVVSFALIEKSVRAVSIRRSVGFALLSGLSIGVMMIEQQDVALLAGLFIGAYALFRLFQLYRKSVLRWLALLLPIALVALPLSAPTVLKSYRVNIAGAASVQGDGDEKWNYITQWSMIPSEWPDLIALGWSGWSTGNPKGPYWGKIGCFAGWKKQDLFAEWKKQKRYAGVKEDYAEWRKKYIISNWGKIHQGENFKLTSSYFGIIPFLLMFFGVFYAFKKRKTEEGE